MLKIKKSELDKLIAETHKDEDIKMIKMSAVMVKTAYEMGKKEGVLDVYTNVCEIIRIYNELKEWLETIIEIEED